MYEIIRTEIKAKLASRIPADMVKDVLTVMDRVMVEYDVVRKETALAVINTSLIDAVKMYLLCRRAEGMAEGSLVNVKCTLKKFAEQVNKPLEEITTNDIRGFLANYQMTHSVKPCTVEKVRERLNTFFKWCVMEERITKNPAARVAAIKAPRSDRHAISEEQLEYCRMACNSLRDKALLEVLYSTGARVSEIARLEKSDVNWLAGSIRVFGKNSEYYTVFLNAKAKVALQNYLDARKDYNKALFVTERGNRKISSAAVRNAIEAIGERAKLDIVLSPHVLRHTMATMALRNGARLEVVQRMLNHKNPSTTQIYAEMCLDDVAADHRRTVI
ncbi:MAG: tyrosine-type recombinase/integrase [Oscillospiraceae bacterium]|nr:tyrosine-type recombinase/integrase [Oscillospiraceae bacterium]